MSEAVQIRMNFRRTTVSGMNLTDAAQVQEWVDRDCDQQILVHGAHEDELVVVTAQGIMVGHLKGTVELGEERALVHLQRAVVPGQAYFRLRVCEVLLPGPEGALRALAQVELWPDRLDWRARVRRFGQTTDGIGVWYGEWEELAGERASEAPEWLHELLDDSLPKAVEMQTEEKKVEPKLDASFALLAPPQGPRPEDPHELLAMVHMTLDQELLRTGLTVNLFFVFRETQAERWEIRSVEGVMMDEVLRALAQIEPAWGAVWVYPGVAELPDGRSLRAIFGVAEIGKTRGLRALPVDLSGATPVAMEPFYAPLKAVEQSWFTGPTPLKMSLVPRGPRA